jgi:hypothetical protein
MPVISALWRLKQKDLPGYIVRLPQKKKKKKLKRTAYK